MCLEYATQTLCKSLSVHLSGFGMDLFQISVRPLIRDFHDDSLHARIMSLLQLSFTECLISTLQTLSHPISRVDLSSSVNGNYNNYPAV
jgi:hypothetical protein